MKVTLISTYGSGGAAIACQRLSAALRTVEVDSRMLVASRNPDSKNYTKVSDSPISYWSDKFNFAMERLMLLPSLKSKKDLYAFSPANLGTDISSHPLILDADIIHLHWFNQGFLSISDVSKIIATRKPIVWTLHDMWAFTGGCHYSGECDHFQTQCGDCPFLRWPGRNDLSAGIWRQKERTFTGHNIQYVACSQWLARIAGRSGLLKNESVTSVPNPIDTTLFKPMDKNACKKELGLAGDKIQLLFGSANIKDERKGFRYMKEALDQICSSDSAAKQRYEVIVFGKADEAFAGQLPMKVNFLGIVGQDRIAKVYNAADMFLIPSLQDNLPNTIMESLACGTPVVGFKTGGIPEMIDHKQNGYLSDYKSVTDLAAGIKWVAGADQEMLAQNARRKVMTAYDEQVIAKSYLAVYEEAIRQNQSIS